MHFQIKIQGRETEGVTKFIVTLLLLETKLYWNDVLGWGLVTCSSAYGKEVSGGKLVYKESPT
jgi:hypothetical protein